MLSMPSSRTFWVLLPQLQYEVINKELKLDARVAPPDVAASGVAPDWASSSSSSSLQDNAFKERLSFSITNFNGGSASTTTLSAAQAAGVSSAQLSKSEQSLNNPSTGAGESGAGATASPSASRWESRSFHPANFPYHTSAFQAAAPTPGSELPMGISEDEAAARHTAGLFASAPGSFSSHRLMEGSMAAMGAAPQEQGGVNNEPNFSSVGRSDLIVRAEDFVGLYPSVGRLSRDIEGGHNIAHSALMHVGAAARSTGPKPAMVSFASGDFRVQTMGRGRMEEGISSMQPLLSAPSRGGAHEAEGERHVPWHHGDPSSGARDMLRTDKSVEAQGMALEAQNIKESTGIGTQSAEHQRMQQPLALARIEADRSGSIAELDQAHQHRLYEQQQQQREMMLRQRSLTGTMACHDCGNQAKKDCVHMRCRTCCKSRGFDCVTHVKSTWVPVSRRRQRLQQAGLLNIAGGSGGGELHFHENMKLAKLKRARTLSLGAGSSAPSLAADQAAPSHTSTSTAGTPPRSTDINSGAAPPPLSQEGHVRGVFPPEVRMQAVLRCVRLTGIVDGQEEYAYQTEVQIGGHTFKGILHDQGIDKSEFGASSLAELQLGGRNVQSSAALMDLPGIYGSSGNTILGAFR